MPSRVGLRPGRHGGTLIGPSPISPRHYSQAPGCPALLRRVVPEQAGLPVARRPADSGVSQVTCSGTVVSQLIPITLAVPLQAPTWM